MASRLAAAAFLCTLCWHNPLGVAAASKDFPADQDCPAFFLYASAQDLFPMRKNTHSIEEDVTFLSGLEAKISSNSQRVPVLSQLETDRLVEVIDRFRISYTLHLAGEATILMDLLPWLQKAYNTGFKEVGFRYAQIFAVSSHMVKDLRESNMSSIQQSLKSMKSIRRLVQRGDVKPWQPLAHPSLVSVAKQLQTLQVSPQRLLDILHEICTRDGCTDESAQAFVEGVGHLSAQYHRAAHLLAFFNQAIAHDFIRNLKHQLLHTSDFLEERFLSVLQEAIFRAALRYDARQGFQFSTLAVTAARNAYLKELDAQLTAHPQLRFVGGIDELWSIQQREGVTCSASNVEAIGERLDIEGFLAKLPRIEREAVEGRFGLRDGVFRGYDEVAIRLRQTRPAIWSRVQRGIKHLEKIMREEGFVE
jgi:DNA-directed RNA polymerase specialized sigma24 family protein